MGRGVTSRPNADEEVWYRSFYEIEAVLDEGEDPQAARGKLIQLIDSWLSEDVNLPTPTEIPKLDIAEINALPWVSYKTKQAVSSSEEAGWIFSNSKGAEELVKAIRKAKGGKLELGTMLYQFSGDNNQFISRRPVKQKK